MSQANHSIRGITCVILACILWGTTGTAASFAPTVNSFATGAFSMGVGGLALCLYARRQLVAEHGLLKKNLKVLFLGGLAVTIYPLAFYTSMRWSGIAIGTVVSLASAPFFSLLLDRLIHQKKMSMNWLISFSFGAFGITLLTIGKQDNFLGLDKSFYLWGLLAGLIAGLSYAVYSWAGKRLIENGVSSNASMASMFGLAALLLLPSLSITGQNVFTNQTNLLTLLYIALIPMFLGYQLFGYALNHIEASQATLITVFEPAVATAFAIIIVGEKFNWIGWSGMIAIMICLLIQLIQPKLATLNTSL